MATSVPFTSGTCCCEAVPSECCAYVRGGNQVCIHVRNLVISGTAFTDRDITAGADENCLINYTFVEHGISVGLLIDLAGWLFNFNVGAGNCTSPGVAAVAGACSPFTADFGTFSYTTTDACVISGSLYLTQGAC